MELLTSTGSDDLSALLERINVRSVVYCLSDLGAPWGFRVDGSATAWNLGTNGQITRRHDFPAEGEYEIRIRAWQEPFGDQPAKMTVRFDNKDYKTYDVPELQEKPGVFTIRRTFYPGNHKIAVAYINNLVDRNNPDPKKRSANGLPKAQWADGQFICPHGAIWDNKGNIIVCEWVAPGRVTKLRRIA